MSRGYYRRDHVVDNEVFSRRTIDDSCELTGDIVCEELNALLAAVPQIDRVPRLMASVIVHLLCRHCSILLHRFYCVVIVVQTPLIEFVKLNVVSLRGLAGIGGATELALVLA